MEYSDRLYLINRISSGVLKFKNIFLLWPTEIDKYLSSEVYREAYEEALLNGALLREETIQELYEVERWNSELNDRWEMAKGDLKNAKVRLFQKYSNKVERVKTKKYIEFVKEQIDEMSKIRMSLDFLTAENIAEHLQLIYLIERSCYFDIERQNPYDFAQYSLSQIAKFYSKNIISMLDLRNLSKDEPWFTMWQTRRANGKIFDNFPLTNDQEQLIGWTLMYDNIRESPECPSNNILKDNDAIDGWMIHTKKKRDNEKLKRDKEAGLSDRTRNADEVYLMASNMEEAKEIYGMNDDYGHAMKTKRFAFLHKYGEASVGQLPDIKQKVQMEINRRNTSKNERR